MDYIRTSDNEALRTAQNEYEMVDFLQNKDIQMEPYCNKQKYKFLYSEPNIESFLKNVIESSIPSDVQECSDGISEPLSTKLREIWNKSIQDSSRNIDHDIYMQAAPPSCGARTIKVSFSLSHSLTRSLLAL